MKDLTVSLRHDSDVGRMRQRIRQLAQHFGLESLTQTCLTIVVSALAYQWLKDVGQGVVACWVEVERENSKRAWRIHFSQEDPIASTVVSEIQELPPDLWACVELVRRFVEDIGIQITISPPYPHIILQCPLPAQAEETSRELTRWDAGLPQHACNDVLAETRQQHQELICLLQEYVSQADKMKQFSRELDDTNRGVVALYTELEARADHLQRLEEAKSRFFSQMSHEFRVPIHAILSLSNLLLDQVDGTLTGEQTKQVNFIRTEGRRLIKLVDDLLDLARSESGRMTLSISKFEISDLFNSLRNILKPLIQDTVELIFDCPENMPPLKTDEEKVTQILRNFVSNALKYTSQGEVRVSASLSSDSETVTFSVRDTGIGIALEDQELIFEAFTQIEHELQKRAKGTGLGLSLCQKLAELLRGQITVESQLGEGATFQLSLPRQYHKSKTHSKEADR